MRGMRRAFTLMELMVVVGIMAFLGLAATNGYNALRRGMAERGAVDAASAILKAARERALVDRVPTAVFCYNRCVREATDDENAVVVGEAVAIRRAGRITKVSGNWLYDEFGDLDRAYDTDKEGELPNRTGLRLWRFDDRKMSDMQYSVVSDGVFCDDNVGNCWSYTPSSGLVSDDPNLTGTGDNNGDGKKVDTKICGCAFYDLGTSKHAPSGGWVVGSGYGFEFQSMRLPDGFIFKRDIPTEIGAVTTPEVFHFDPESSSVTGGGSDSIDIYSCRMQASGFPTPDRKAGTASGDMEAAK